MHKYIYIYLCQSIEPATLAYQPLSPGSPDTKECYCEFDNLLVFCSTVRECGGSATLVAAEAREGSWGTAPRGPGPGFTVEWPGDNATLRAGDRSVWLQFCTQQSNYTFVIHAGSQIVTDLSDIDAVHVSPIPWMGLLLPTTY